jgi:hypothetical protein
MNGNRMKLKIDYEPESTYPYKVYKCGMFRDTFIDSFQNFEDAVKKADEIVKISAKFPQYRP